MKILHTVRQYRPVKGGLENYTEALARAQAALGHDVTVLTLNSSFHQQERVFPKDEFVNGIHVKRVNYYGKNRLFFPAVAPAFFKNYDVIHAHAFDQLTDIVGFYLRFTKKPFYITTHGLFFHTQKLRCVKEVYLRTISKFTAARADKIYACSENDCNQLKAVNIPSEIAYNPVTPLANAKAAGESFLYLGRISENKRVCLAIDFFAEYVRRTERKDVRFHIVGGDQENLTDGLTAQVEKLNLNEQVLFHGFVDQNFLASVIKDCGYSLSASAYEGYGLAAVEGMSVGLIPVLHDNAAFREIYQRSGCGLVADFGCIPEAVAQFIACKEMISNQDARNRAIDFALSNSYAAMAERTLADYQNAVSEQRTRVFHNEAGTEIRMISGLPVSALSLDAALNLLTRAIEKRDKVRVCFANANLAVQLQRSDPETRKEIIDSFNLILNDGVALDLASRYLYGKKFPANLNGTDFTPAFLSRLAPGTKFYFYGSDPLTGRAAADFIAEKYRLECVGFTDGFTRTPEDFIQKINELQPAVILVAKGNPRQERWIAEHGAALDAPVIMGVGALADFLTGKFKRAPQWVRDIRCEWAYRLLNEPKRLFKRYTIDMFGFAKTVVKNM